MQHYLVKGVRKASKSRSSNIQYFQPGAILSLEVYHNSLKELQYLKDFQWHHVYQNTYAEVIRHSIAVYCAELADILIKEPESDPDFYTELENIFRLLDSLPIAEVSNIPVFFTLKILGKIGFSLSGKYEPTNFDVLDFEKGSFCATIPLHPFYLKGPHAKFVSDIFYTQDWTIVHFNGEGRSYVLRALQDYFKIHIENFRPLKSLTVLETIFC